MTGTQALVAVRDGEVRTTSVDIAQAFEKAHKDVLRAVDNLLASLPEEHGRNFAPMLAQVKIGSGAKRNVRAFEITRDGFSLLAMGFTGAKALEWKLKFLEAFNVLETAMRASTSDNDNVVPLRPPEHPFGSRQWLVHVDVITAHANMLNRVYGPEHAARVLQEWGFAGPKPEDRQIALPPPPEQGSDGPPYMWQGECGLRKSLTELMGTWSLYEHYSAWCARRNYKPLPVEKWKIGMRLQYGEPEVGGLWRVKMVPRA